MIGGNNKYVLNLHYNLPGSYPDYNPQHYNYQLTYKIGDDLYLAGIYDKEFSGNYIPNSHTYKTSLYGSFPQHGCYSFANSKFSFLAIYPERMAIDHGNNTVRDSVKFALGTVNSVSGNELNLGLLDDNDPSKGLVLLDSRNNRVKWPISVGLDYEYSSSSKEMCKPGVGRCTSVSLEKDYGNLSDTTLWESILGDSRVSELVIPINDIDFNRGKSVNDISKGATYKIKTSASSTSTTSVKIYKKETGVAEEEIGELHNKTFGVKSVGGKSEPTIDKISFNDSSELKYQNFQGGDITLGNDIVLTRNQHGVFEFYTSSQPQFCQQIGCEINKINLFPNIKNYLKSTLVAADIGDFHGANTVSEALVAGSLANNAKFWENIAGEPILQQSVAAKLRADPGDAQGPEGKQGIQGNTGARGPVGPPGPAGHNGTDGKDSDPARVAEELIAGQANELAEAVLGIEVSGKSKLSLELAKDGYFQADVSDILKRDYYFKMDVRGDPGLPGEPGQDANASEIMHKLAQNTRFKRSLKGDDGSEGPQGVQGLAGQDRPQGPRGREGKHGKRGENGAEGPAGKNGQDGQDGAMGPQGNPGPPGRDANPADVAEQLITTKANELGQAVLNTTSSSGENLATQVAGKVNLNKQEFLNQVNTDKLAELLFGNSQITPSEAKEHIIGGWTTPQPGGSNAQPAVSTWGLAKYLLVHSGLDANGARGLVETKVSQSKLAHDLLEKAGLDKDASKASATVDHILNHFFSTRVGAVTAALRSNPGRARGPKGDQGETGGDGEPGQDANASEIMHKLAQNTRFKRSLKGDDGAEGPQGVQGLAGQDGPQGPRGREGKQGKRGGDGPEGQQGERGADGDQGPRGREGKQGKKGEDGPEGLPGKQGDQGQDANASEVMHKLVQNTRFKRSLKGDDGAEGQQGDPGQDGPQGPRGRDGKQGKKGEDGPEGQQGERGDDGAEGQQGERGADGDPGPRGREGKQGKRGEDGVDSFTLDSGLKRSTRELQKKPQLKIVPGESYDENKKEANIELEVEGKGVVIATFLEIGYFFKNDELYIRNHVTGNNVLIPKNFHFLKVVEDGLDSYKLAFCNNLGNLFFDYKKYDQEYAGLPEEHKLINLKYIKNAVSIDLSKYYYHTHTPLFAVKKGELEGQSLENYRADVYEIEKNKKIGTLIDEFGCFECDLFRHVDHHQGYDRSSQELDVRIGDHEGNFQIGDNIVHPIAFDFDLLNYLDYQINFVLDS